MKHDGGERPTVSWIGRPKTPLEGFRFDRREVGGAIGDLGVFIPLWVGLVNRCGLQLGPVLFFAGLMNLVTGLMFRIPMPVQPMKAIAAVAIAEGLNESEILAAGIITGAVILMLTVTGLIDWLNRSIPKSVVRGLQVGLGLALLGRGLMMVVGTDTLFGWDSVGLGIVCVVLIVLLRGSTRLPGVLVVFGLGLLSLMFSEPSIIEKTRLGMAWDIPDLSNVDDWVTGLLEAAVPQIPLTTLNSVIAVSVLSADLFPKQPALPRRVGMSVALMNLMCCPFGGMPVCHGAGGLASQYRFGARTGGSMVMLGVVKMVLALLFGGSLLVWLHHYPQSILGVLLFFSGGELVMIGRDQRSPVDFFVMALTAGLCLGINSTFGFLIGWPVGLLFGWYSARDSKFA